MPTPHVPPSCGEKPSPGLATITISEASAASAGRGGGDGASVHPLWFWGGGARARDVAEGGRARTPPVPHGCGEKPFPSPGTLYKASTALAGRGGEKASPCAPRGFGEGGARDAAEMEKARTPPMSPGCDCGEKPYPVPVTISKASAASAGRRGGDGASGRWRRIWGGAAVVAAELGRLTSASWCGENSSTVHVTPPRASGDSALSREGI